MKINQLRNLVAVIEAGSVRQAARNLNVSQSAVTKSIKQLEERLGVELLLRASHGVSGTAAGKALANRAKVIEAELRHARNEIDAIQGGDLGEIRVQASPSVMLGLLPKAIIEFKRTRPKVSFQIGEGLYPEVLPAIRKGDIDFAICLVPERSRDRELNFELLVGDRLVPAVRSDHPLTRHGGLLLSDLVDQDWVSYSRSQTGRDIFEQTFILNDLNPPDQMIKTTSFSCAISLVEHSDYITLVPEKTFMDKTLRKSITPLRMGTTMPPWNVMIISRARHKLSPLCIAFLNYLK